MLVLVNRRRSSLNCPIDDGHVITIDESSGPARDGAQGINPSNIYKRHDRSSLLIPGKLPRLLIPGKLPRRRGERFADPVAILETAFQYAAILVYFD